ncbi:MAG: DUF3048 domain-containing protein [Clostridia bacterium]|nr:DUF3048 domain-containing protein [Clostridia bacterium]
MKSKKNVIKVFCVITVLIIGAIVLINILKDKQSANTGTESSNFQIKENTVVSNNQENESDESDKVDIIDVNSKSRPYAIVINNTPIAVKVQTGLNKAYIVYEIPTEGFTSRLMALFKDIPEDLTVGTIRSARHNFIDYALESDAIFVHFGWSGVAEKQEKSGVIDYINGLFDTPFWRNNPENLPSEHTAYTSINKLKQTIQAKNYRTELKDDNLISLLKYASDEVDLSKEANAEEANQIVIPYGDAPNITSFIYDKDNKVYYRQENGNTCVDYNTKEKVNTKNIIVQKITYEGIKNSKYLNLHTTGTGKGYYITNGYAVPITWKKAKRNEKTRYYYSNGKEIKVNDGRTYIEIQTDKKELTIK